MADVSQRLNKKPRKSLRPLLVIVNKVVVIRRIRNERRIQRSRIDEHKSGPLTQRLQTLPPIRQLRR